MFTLQLSNFIIINLQNHKLMKAASKNTSQQKPSTQKSKFTVEVAEQHQITVVMTDGTEFTTLTTNKKIKDKLILDTCPKKHPAWQENNGQSKVNVNDKRVSDFNSKFGNFGAIMSIKAEDAGNKPKE
jgi:large subunit ribosomal protein L31